MRGRTTQMEIDHQALFAPLTKKTMRLRADAVRSTIFEAARIAMEGRPGPVHIGLPVGLSAEKASLESIGFTRPNPAAPADPLLLAEAARLFAHARKPMLVVGLGAVHAHVDGEIKTLAEDTASRWCFRPWQRARRPRTILAMPACSALSDMVGKLSAGRSRRGCRLRSRGFNYEA
jgi:acetolactate synthase-1/2/3 large subunit